MIRVLPDCRIGRCMHDFPVRPTQSSQDDAGFRSTRQLGVPLRVQCVGAILVAVVGWWTAGVVERLSRRALVRVAHTDGTVAGFLSSLARYAVLVVAAIITLPLIGIQATSLIAVLGATLWR